MDNNNLSNVPVSELSKQPDEKTSLADNTTSASKKTISKKTLIIIITCIIVLIGIGVALYFILRKPATSPESSDGAEQPDSTVVWTPPEDSLDPSNDYVVHHQEIIDSADTSFDEKLDSEISIANLYSVTDMYAEAEAILNAIDRSSLTHRQLFRVYSAYSYLYEHSGDEAKHQEYAQLVEEVLNQFWDEESAAPPYEAGE